MICIYVDRDYFAKRSIEDCEAVYHFILESGDVSYEEAVDLTNCLSDEEAREMNEFIKRTDEFICFDDELLEDYLELPDGWEQHTYMYTDFHFDFDKLSEWTTSKMNKYGVWEE